MKHFGNLIETYRASGGDPSAVSIWWGRSRPSADQLAALAEAIGAEYLTGGLTYSLANGLLNQLMPLAGFDQAPKRFWQYYVAFEDSETLPEPDPQVRLAVQAVINAGAR